jgi:hypothetical protein
VYLCRIDVGKSDEILEELERFAEDLRERSGCDVYLYGSFARGDVHEGSGIDLIIVDDFGERFFERIEKILELTDLPVEPLVYTREEFEGMKEDAFIKGVMKEVVRL